MRGLAPLMLLLSAPAAAAMQLGVNTHFDQGWTLSRFEQVEASGAGGIRDTLTWGKIEKQPGVYDFDGLPSAHAVEACRRKIPLLVGLHPRNRLYDGGHTVRSAEGQRAFAAYAAALAEQFPCIVGIEVGNEINSIAPNGPNAVSPEIYVALLRQVRERLKARRTNVALIAGSTQSVAVGYLTTLFRAGLLPLIDGVAVHPYHAFPERLPQELDRLKNAMARFGATKPIWASEFGLNYRTPDAAPAHALKTITLMSAADVKRADWYALIDEPAFPGMGLFADHARKPAFDTFRLAAVDLLAAGNATRIDVGDPLTYVFRFGTGAYVMWGDRSISFAGQARVRDARGNAVPVPARLRPDPIVVDGDARYALGPPEVLADTMWGYGEPGLDYFVAAKSTDDRPLGWIDGKWASHIGKADRPNFRVMPGNITVGAAGALVERHVATAATAAFVSGCFQSRGKPVQVRILHNGATIFSGLVDRPIETGFLPVSLARGDRIDMVYSSPVPDGPRPLVRRVRITKTAMAGRPLCVPETAAAP